MGESRKQPNGTSSVFSMSTTLIFHSDCIMAADWSSRYCAAASALPVTCTHTKNSQSDHMWTAVLGERSVRWSQKLTSSRRRCQQCNW
jgi:hypothetical protein